MDEKGSTSELLIANKELAFQIAEKEKLTAELFIADKEKTILTKALLVADEEKAKREDELVIADQDKANRAAELVIANIEKANRADELVVINEEKTKLAAELIIAKSDKAKRAAELVIAKSEKAKRSAELVIANLEKEKLAGELIIAGEELTFQNKEKAKRAAELVIANINKTKRNAELVIANIEKAKRAAAFVIDNKKLYSQTVEKAKLEAEFVIADAEKAKSEAELVIANIKKAKRSAGLIIAHVEKAKQAAELVIANKELVYQKSEKAKRAAALVIANVVKAKRAAEFVIANLDRAKHAADFVITDKELVLKKEKERLVIELIGTNKELAFQIKEKEKREEELIIINAVLEDQNKEKEKHALELINAKEKAEESDRLKTAFLTNMSHEIRTPMNGILGFAELLKEPNLSSDVLKDYIQTIQISGARMLNTINSIVDMSKIESGLIQMDIREMKINEKMEFTYKFFKPEADMKGLQLILKSNLHDKEAIIKTDNEKVYGILTNLVRNAIKFTLQGSIEFGYEKKGEFLEFFVKDTGIGIPKNQQKIIFERFRQGSEAHNRGYEGSGLGLSISKSYVEMLGGKMSVDSEEGQGSTFYFTIPCNSVSDEKTIIENGTIEKDKEVEIKKLKILIVEDDEISYSLLTKMLQKISSKVLQAVTGVQATEACLNNPDLDLVLMDIRMPVMDGIEATRQIRQFNKDIIIIAQTAFAFMGDSQKAIEAGCTDYISKPINKTLLIELINKYFNKK